MDSMSMSLDDIIKKNKVKKGGIIKNKGGTRKIVNQAKGTTKKFAGIQKKKLSPVKKTNFDARLKIIQKNRTKIHDAREKIAENARKHIRDARELLSSNAKVVNVKKQNHIPRSRSAHLHMDDDLLMDEDDIDLEDLKSFKTKPIASIRRTVQNDIFRSAAAAAASSQQSLPIPRMPKLPTFSIQNRDVSPTLDPFDCYVPTRRPPVLLAPPAPPTRTERFQAGKIMNAHMDSYMKSVPIHKGILRTASRADDHDDRFESDRYIVTEPIKSSRYTSDSAGIFAKIPDLSLSSSSKSQKGYRIIVSNLVETVNEADIRELFSDVGELLSAKMIRPGTAEIIYRNRGDDEKAHDTYHNRALDGKPMKIAMVTAPTQSAYYR